MTTRLSRIRVLQLIGTMHIGGAERVVQHLARHLDRDRFDIEVCCTKSTGVLSDELAAEGIRVRALAAQSRFEKHAVPFRLRRLIGAQKYDVVHAHDFSTFLDCGMLRLLATPATLLTTLHFGNYPHIGTRQLYAQRVAARLTNRLIAVSEAQRRAVIEHLWVPSERITTIYNGVTPNPNALLPECRSAVRAELGVSDATPVVGCIATMTRQKGIPHLIDAAALVAKRRPDALFVIIGGGPMLEEMRGLAATRGVRDYVRFLGWRDNATSLLPGLDLVVSSSLWEGFAMVLLEAMAAGKPVVATDVGDNRVAVPDGVAGRIVPPRNSQALADAITSLLQDPRQLEQLGRNAYDRFASRFTVDQMVRQYAECYESCVARVSARNTKRQPNESVIPAQDV